MLYSVQPRYLNYEHIFLIKLSNQTNIALSAMMRGSICCVSDGYWMSISGDTAFFHKVTAIVALKWKRSATWNCTERPVDNMMKNKNGNNGAQNTKKQHNSKTRHPISDRKTDSWSSHYASQLYVGLITKFY